MKYNYHSHTFRCGHTDNSSDENYIVKAIEYNYKKYGISDHVPVYPLMYTDPSIRMNHNLVNDYIKSINSLKEKYKNDLTIYSGFEVEYDYVIEPFLVYLREQVDYLILGQHFVFFERIRDRLDYPVEYAKVVCKAIDSGLFDYIAHPDIFYKFKPKNLNSIEEQEYNKYASIATDMLINKTKEYNIPLELNLGDDYTKEELSYPNKDFWNKVKESNNTVVIGIDAHSTKEIEIRDTKIERISKFIDINNLNILDDYDPVIYRTNNKKINDAYINTKNNIDKIETRLIKYYNDIDKLICHLKKENEHANKHGFSTSESDKETRKLRDELIEFINNNRDNNLIEKLNKYYEI